MTFFGATAKRFLTEATKEAESKTAAEIVIVVRPASERYRHVDLAAGVFVATVLLCVFLYAPRPFEFTYLPLELTGAFGVGVLVSLGVPAIKRALVSNAAMTRAVRRAACEAFVDRGVYRTTGRTGTQRYWVAAYRAQGLRNVTGDPTIVTCQLSKVTRDPYFDAVTVRVFATCKDYTLDASGKVVGGDRERERRYSEYWTFIRSVNTSGEPKAKSGCPNCGAPIASIGMAGICGSCNAKVTSGDFDWILSRIEQDEVYAL